MPYKEYRLNITKGQAQSIVKGHAAKIPVKLRLSNTQLKGDTHTLQLTDRHITKMNKAKANGKGCDITLSKKNLQHNAKIGGFLPALLAMLPTIIGVSSAIAGGASGIASAVNAKKAQKKAQAEIERHNKVVESQLTDAATANNGSGVVLAPFAGQGMYLAPFKRGSGLQSKTRGKKKSPFLISTVG